MYGGFEHEVRVFDCRGAGTIGGTSWAALGCDAYIPYTSGAPAAFSDACLIPSARGDGYGEVIGSSYSLLGVDVRVWMQTSGYNTPVEDILFRMCLMEDVAPNLGIPMANYGFQDWSYANSTLQSFPAWGAVTNARYGILDDKMKLFPAGGWVSTDGNYGVNKGCIFDLCKRWPGGRRVHTKPGAAHGTPAIAKLSDYNVFLCAMRTALTGSTITYHFTSRAYYST